MKVIIEGSPKEIAALVVEVQERQDGDLLKKALEELPLIGQVREREIIRCDNSCSEGRGLQYECGGTG